MAQPGGGSFSTRGLDDPRLRRRIPPRWRDIDGLLEEGSVERIGLVEDGQHLELAVAKQGLDRQLVAGDETSTMSAGRPPSRSHAATIAATRWKTSGKLPASSTRITPWLPERSSGLTTLG